MKAAAASPRTASLPLLVPAPRTRPWTRATRPACTPSSAASCPGTRRSARSSTPPASRPPLERGSAAGTRPLPPRRGFEERWHRSVRQPLQRCSAPHQEPPARSTGSEHGGLPLLVLRAWRRCLGDDSLQPGDDVFSHGADSLTGMEVLDAISAAIGLQLPAALLFDAPTPAGLAARSAALPAFGTPPAR